jgi:hypothetical protein
MMRNEVRTNEMFNYRSDEVRQKMPICETVQDGQVTNW